MGETNNKATVQKILQAAMTKDWDEWAKHFHEDLVIDWPQSGERVEGRDTATELHSNVPDDGASGELLSVRGEGDLVVSEVKLRYGDGSTWFWANIYEFLDGKVARVTGYFAESTEPPDWRAQWVTKV
ncbi:MAG TPA: nuclear transport factor 2 family protein [Actinomycetota bacterium]|nr:nuclear transport factor 2 family protein [Actinomycetota bacterium]